MTRCTSLVGAVLAALLVGCAGLPPSPGRTPSSVLTDTADTRLGRAIALMTAAAPAGTSGIHAFAEPRDAFAARMLLAAAAEKSIDAQYYIWYDDRVGLLLFEALWKAAERGVRVRLLLDDINTKGLDPLLATLCAHPNVEVRLYNPFVERNSRWWGYLTEFGRLNKRMHNKSFTADNQATIVGGRNIGNEYFGAGDSIGFVDLDALAIGPAVREVSEQFDLYWNSASAYPAAAIVGAPSADGAAALEVKFAATRADPSSVEYLKVVGDSPLIAALQARRLLLDWSISHVVYDDPTKTLSTDADPDALLFPELVKKMGRPEALFDIVSPYFVPGDVGTASLTEMARRGVKVRILTNSLAATDVSVVHAGYEKRRRDLLLAGVILFELKPTATAQPSSEDGKVGSSAASGLHAKTYAVDAARIFIGSFNFDPRSARLNTEMGLVIDSAQLAGRLASAFETAVPQLAYEVRLSPEGGSLVWIERTSAGEELRYDHDPGTSAFKRALVRFLSILPIEWLL